MKNRTLFLLLITTTLSVCAEESRYPLAQFLSDTQLDLTLRSHWKYLKENEAQPKAVHNAWGQAVSLDYRSGWLWNTLGFDVSYTRAVKLAASDYFATRGILYNHGEGFNKNNAGGFGRFGQRYLKLRLGDEAAGLNAKGGWHQLKNVGVLTDVYRLSRNSYLGYSASLNWQDLRLDAAWVTRAISFDAPDRVRFLTADNKPIEAIWTSGISYRRQGAGFAGAWGESKDYLRRYLIEADYSLTSDWSLATQIYASSALEKYKAMPQSRKQFDNKATHYAGEARWQEDRWSQKVGVAWTKAEKTHGVGYYDRFMGKNTRGRFNALTSAGKDYMRDGELALTSLTQYQLSDSLSSGVQVNYGQFDYKDNRVRTGEITLLGRWQPANGKMKDLAVAAQCGYGWSYKNNQATPLLDADGKYMRSPNLSGEIAVTWKFGLL